jgi:hypothetical protein
MRTGWQASMQWAQTSGMGQCLIQLPIVFENEIKQLI